MRRGHPPHLAAQHAQLGMRRLLVTCQTCGHETVMRPRSAAAFLRERSGMVAGKTSVRTLTICNWAERNPRSQ